MMNAIEISCPSKTFALGEYGVLDQGSAVLFNTFPRIKCRISKIPKASLKNTFAAASPAGQWIKKNPLDFSDTSLEWLNPSFHKGFGFSSAQFNIVYAYSFFLKGCSIETIKPQSVWQAYLSMNFEGQKPSGADILSQWVGGVCIFEQDPFFVQSLTASFPNIGFFILKTGEQLSTHDYLKNLKLNNVSDLKKIAKKGIESMKLKKEEDFVESIKEYGEQLIQKNFVTQKTYDILKKISSLSGVQACKGCGAMGAETILLIFDKKDKSQIRSQIQDFEILTDESQLTYGIAFHEISKKKGLES